MKAVTQHKYGSADVLDFGEVPVPTAGAHDVLVRVVAAGVDRGAWHFMTGQPYLMRLLGFGLRGPKVPVPGTNVAGYVEATGPGVREFQAGDEVYGTARGAYAEYVRMNEDKIARKPTSLSFEEAAVLPYAGFAAIQALREHGHVRSGEKVLVVGASGAVGSAAVQLGKAMGAHITGVCSGAAEGFVAGLGAEAIIDYRRSDLSTLGRYDLIVDIGGSTPVRRLRHALQRRGRLIIVGGEGGRWTGVRRQVWATLMSPFVPQQMGSFVAKENRALLEDLNRFVADGQVRPSVRRTYPLVEAADALRSLDVHHEPGRIAITI